MAAGSSNDDDEITGINVTPLVDVMLVLLIIFMVTASYIVNRSINIKLPHADTAEDQLQSKNLAFVLDEKSALYLDGKPIAWDDIAKIIREQKEGLKGAAAANLQALISADTATPHGAVVKLIDMVRKNGINDFAINVDAQALKSTDPDVDKSQ